ncbi:MAG: BamA/TamA family outer membrane protein [Candidatus Omnitrophota bacterium]
MHCKKQIVFLAVFFLGVAGCLYAESLSYDPYETDQEAMAQAPSTLQSILSHFPVYPFELLRWPIEKTLVMIENHSLDRKTRWVYNELVSRGIKPHFNVINVMSPSYGADFDLVRLSGLSPRLHDTVAETWIHYSQDIQFTTGARGGLDNLFGLKLRTRASIEYEDRPNEHFYGIGPDTSRGEGSVYATETTKLRGEAAYECHPQFETKGFLGYDNVNVSGGHDGGRNQIGRGIFTEALTPGLRGDEILSLGGELKFDNRDQKENSTRGGLARFAMSYHEGVSGSAARFLRYTGEASHYLSLGSPRRVLVGHLFAEYNDELGHGIIPFHQMPMLGDYGAEPRLSHTLRGYDFNRFRDESAALFNAEYRHNIWEYRLCKLDTVYFFDLGQVFGEVSEMQLHDFRESYGGGFRFSVANVPVLSIEVAHGDEGTNLYVKSKLPF